MPSSEDRVGRAARGLSRRLASATTRRSFLATVAGAALAAVGARTPESDAAVRGSARTTAGWFGFCGHTWTTGSCPSPYVLPRIDALGYPLRPSDGHPVDNLGRPIDSGGNPVDASGARLLAPDGAPLPPAPRTRLCQDWVPERYGLKPVLEGAWYRCCNGRIRRLTDCCSTSRVRINGDASLVGYCRPGRRVFCVVYMDTGVPC